MLPSRALCLLVLSSLAPACADGPPPSLRSPPERAIYCSVTFSPDEALVADTEAAAERWSLATGCAVLVSDAGIPVELATIVLRPDGSEAPGVTSPERDRVEVNARCGAAQRPKVVLHEMGHALGGDHVASDGVLSGEKHRRDVIDLPALESVCSRLPCLWLSPE